MKIFITGGTGLIGNKLIESLLIDNHEITVLTRNIANVQKKLGSNIKYCSSLNSLANLNGYGAVINLAGEPIGEKKWTTKHKERLCQSRWTITQQLSTLIKNSHNPPQVFISGSAIGYYGAQEDNILTEKSIPHREFLHDLCAKWEALALESRSEKTRVCILRTAIVLSTKGGILPKLITLFKLGLGTVFGTGNQYVSWIHIQDMVDGILFLLNTSKIEGVFNFTSPNPVTNREFSKTLSESLNSFCIFRIRPFLVKLIMGEMSTLLLDGQRAIPTHLEELGYKFTFENIDEALMEEILNR